jgi:predicted RNA binding protein YcfA (HicA-like mRNA interferase family)
MSRFPLISGKNLLRLLQQLGFEISHIEGSHHYLRHPDGRRTTVPIHRNEDLQRSLIKLILRQADVSIEDYLRLR